MKNKNARSMIESIFRGGDDICYPFTKILPWKGHPWGCGFDWLPDEVVQRDKAIKRKVKKLLTEEQWTAILDTIEESEGGSEFKLLTPEQLSVEELREFSEEYEDERLPLGIYFVDQQCGYLGDDYHGHISIPISKKRILRYYFSM